MIQVDVFWSFAMGAAFATCASEGLKKSDSGLVNKYFVYTISYLSLIFAPSGAYLLWQHTGWETMFMLDRSLHGIWVCLFANTNVLLGVLGFLLSYRAIKSGDDITPLHLYLGAYTCMFAILTLGYNRFLYAGTLEDWNNGVKYPLTDFFKSEVFFTLLVMSVFVLPPIYYSAICWPREFGLTSEKKFSRLKDSATVYVSTTTAVAGIYNILHVTSMLPPGWQFDRLIAFFIGQVVFGSLLFAPLILVPVKVNADSGDQKKKKH